MEIKTLEKQSGLIKGTKKFVKKRSRWKWIFMGLLLLGAFGVSNLISIYYGAKLQTEGNIHFVKRWGSTAVNKPLSIVSNIWSGFKADPDVMQLDIKFENYQKILYARDLALKYGPAYRVHPTNPGYVPTDLTFNGKTSKAKVRLKGGQVEHFGHPKKMSFKIKMKGSDKVDGMKFFSIQQAKNRVYINEWILHKFLAYNNLIALNYKYIKVTVNGDNLGVYSLEENMGKQLIERNGRKEGPIINYNSDLRWDYTPGQAFQLWGADINAFNDKNIADNPTLQKNFEVARSLLEGFRQETLSADQVFDVEKLATFFAIIDLTGNQHATTLNNMKFYYNPITAMIEPIGYDNGYFTRLPNKPLYGEHTQLKLTPETEITKEWETPWYKALFSDVVFVKEYIDALEKFSDRTYMEGFFESIQEDFDKNVQIIRSDQPWYNYDGEFENPDNLYHNQDYINRLLHPKKALQTYYDAASFNGTQLTLPVANIASLPIEIVGLNYRDTAYTKLDKPIILQAHQDKAIEYTQIQLPVPDGIVWQDSMVQDLKIQFRVMNVEGFSEDAIYPYVPTTPDFDKVDLMRMEPNVAEFDFLNVDETNKLVTFKSGQTWTLDKTMVVPRGYTLQAFAPLEIDMVNNAKILTYSPIEFVGKEESFIKIYSSDSTANGIVVMKADGRSKLDFVHFNHMSNPVHGNWAITGAISFFESPVDFNTCYFANNLRGDDYLNTIRTDFTMKNTTFDNILSDAFDADFCSGVIDNTFFLKVGNDGVDVSGANLVINNITLDSIGDKALSAGEDSKMVVNGAKISNSELGVTSKDKSVLTINNVTMDNTKLPYTAFQKKPEFGIGKIIATNSTLTGAVEEKYLIEEGSVMTLDGKTIETSGEAIKKILYGVMYGEASKR